jgi:hypothetical protein
MRCLLEQQDRLLELEKQLNENDDAENVQLNLSSRRQDHNQSRRALIGEIRAELQDYGSYFPSRLPESVHSVFFRQGDLAVREFVGAASAINKAS